MGVFRSGSERPPHIRARSPGENREARGRLGQRERQAQRGDKKEAETKQGRGSEPGRPDLGFQVVDSDNLASLTSCPEFIVAPQMSFFSSF